VDSWQPPPGLGSHLPPSSSGLEGNPGPHLALKRVPREWPWFRTWPARSQGHWASICEVGPSGTQRSLLDLHLIFGFCNHIITMALQGIFPGVEAKLTP
jgi:hypothetical protein